MEVQGGEGLMPLSALEEYNKKAKEPLKKCKKCCSRSLKKSRSKGYSRKKFNSILL